MVQFTVNLSLFFCELIVRLRETLLHTLNFFFLNKKKRRKENDRFFRVFFSAAQFAHCQ